MRLCQKYIGYPVTRAVGLYGGAKSTSQTYRKGIRSTKVFPTMKLRSPISQWEIPSMKSNHWQMTNLLRLEEAIFGTKGTAQQLVPHHGARARAGTHASWTVGTWRGNGHTVLGWLHALSHDKRLALMPRFAYLLRGGVTSQWSFSADVVR